METEMFRVNLADWIKQEETESGENAFYHPNTEYFKVMREINQYETEFIANSGDLVKMAKKHSATYNQLNEKDKDFVDFRLEAGEPDTRELHDHPGAEEHAGHAVREEQRRSALDVRRAETPMREGESASGRIRRGLELDDTGGEIAHDGAGKTVAERIRAATAGLLEKAGRVGERLRGMADDVWSYATGERGAERARHGLVKKMPKEEKQRYFSANSVPLFMGIWLDSDLIERKTRAYLAEGKPKPVRMDYSEYAPTHQLAAIVDAAFSLGVIQEIQNEG